MIQFGLFESDYGYLGNYSGLDEPVMADNLEVMQCTGLKDKNGKEIYEGDILENISVVCFQRGRFQPIYDGGDAEEMEDEFYRFSSKSEVIGNIYENPELLK